MKRTPMTRRTRLSPKSKKRERDEAERRIVVEHAKIRDRNMCQARAAVPEISCGGPLDPHEIIPRSAWARGWLVLSNVLMVCRAHHDWIGDNPADAHAVGLHGFSWERPD